MQSVAKYHLFQQHRKATASLFLHCYVISRSMSVWTCVLHRKPLQFTPLWGPGQCMIISRKPSVGKEAYGSQLFLFKIPYIFMCISLFLGCLLCWVHKMQSGSQEGMVTRTSFIKIKSSSIYILTISLCCFTQDNISIIKVCFCKFKRADY